MSTFFEPFTWAAWQ